MAGQAKPVGASRRGVLLGGAALGGLAAAGPIGRIGGPASSAALPSRPPVVGFHADRPFLDATGTAEPYRPAEGLRGAEAVAGLSGHLSPRIHLI